MTDCIFCRIVRNELPSHKVYEDENVLAFLDINPLSPGHTLVIPKRHATDIFELEGEDAGALMRGAQKVARALIETIRADGINLLNSNKMAAGQVVFHYHMHIIPRFENDGVRLFTPERKHDVDLKELAEKIRKRL